MFEYRRQGELYIMLDIHRVLETLTLDINPNINILSAFHEMTKCLNSQTFH